MATQRRKWSGGGTAGWLPTTRPVPTPVGAQGGMPPSPELQDKTRKPGFAPYEGYEWQWNDTVNQWQQVKTRTPGIQDVYAHPEKYGFPLAPGYKPTTPTTPAKRHIPGFFRDGSLRDWQGQDWLARMQQLLDNLPAPLKDWLSNYPRLPQSTIPTPTVEYPAPGRPPQSTIPTPAVEYPAPGRPPKYNNPFAWRQKNNGWW